MALIDRPLDAGNLRDAVSRAPVTLLTGPRQAGKSTLARQTVASSPQAFFDLEDHRDLARLAEPTLALRDAGPHSFPLTDHITAITATDLLAAQDPLADHTK
ncbi:AAA family ATPase [Candidatus Poriferisocius sp.]|uniref:AAA family ATPase n=1 Tax=Candidatus Poriferisocius sp. TaxID=3101276 RepID=UPI003B02CB4E